MSGKDALCSTLAAGLLFLVLAPVAAEAAACPHSGDLVTALSAPDRRAALLCAVDAERTARGLVAVGESGQLMRAAQGHADDMVARRYFAHVSPGARPSATASTPPATSGPRDWALGEASAGAAAARPRHDVPRLAGQPARTARSSSTAASASRRRRPPGLTDGSARPRRHLRARLRLPHRRPRRTLPRWQLSDQVRAHVRGRSRPRPARCASTSTRSRRSTPGRCRSSTPSATTSKATRADVADYLLDARRDQLRLGLVPDAAQAPADGRVGLLHGRLGPRRPLPRARAVDERASCARCAPSEIADALGQRRDHELMAPLRPGAARARRASSATAARSTSSREARRIGRSASPSCSPRAWRCSPTAASTSARRSPRSDLALAGVADVRRHRPR